MIYEENEKMNVTGMDYDYFSGNGHKGKCPPDSKKWIRIKEATIRYGVSRPTIDKWCKDTPFKLKIGGVALIDSEALDSYVESFRLPGRVGY